MESPKFPWWVGLPASVGFAVMGIVAPTFLPVWAQAGLFAAGGLAVLWSAVAGSWHYRRLYDRHWWAVWQQRKDDAAIRIGPKAAAAPNRDSIRDTETEHAQARAFIELMRDWGKPPGIFQAALAAQESPIEVADQLYIDADEVKDAEGNEIEGLYAVALCLWVTNGSKTGAVLRNLQARLHSISGESYLLPIRDAEGGTVDLRHGEFARIEVGRVLARSRGNHLPAMVRHTDYYVIDDRHEAETDAGRNARHPSLRVSSAARKVLCHIGQMTAEQRFNHIPIVISADDALSRMVRLQTNLFADDASDWLEFLPEGARPNDASNGQATIADLWRATDPFQLYQAACLWVGESPPSDENGQLSAPAIAMLHRLKKGVRDGHLPYFNDRDGFGPRLLEAQKKLSALRNETLPVDNTAEVGRAGLRAFAETIGERPAFLFGDEE